MFFLLLIAALMAFMAYIIIALHYEHKHQWGGKDGTDKWTEN